jgi:hypothetical protein
LIRAGGPADLAELRDESVALTSLGASA